MIFCSLTGLPIRVGDVIEVHSGTIYRRSKVISVDEHGLTMDDGTRLEMPTDYNRSMRPPNIKIRQDQVFQRWPGRRRVLVLDSWDVVASFA